MSKEIIIKIVESRKDLYDFVTVPHNIYRDNPNYTPPLIMERMEHLSAKNPYFKHADHRFFVAYQGDKTVGRISAQIDQAAQKEDQDKIGHFGFTDAINEDVLKSLFNVAENWLRESGVKLIQGPYSLSINDEAGLLVEGFENPAYMMMNHAPHWMGDALEQFGYKKAKDLLAFHVRTDHDLRGAARMAEKALTHSDISIRSLDKKNIKGDLETILDIFNEAWANNWGFVPMNSDEISYTAKNMKPLIQPDLVKIINIDGLPAAMIVGLPDLNELLEGLNGRLFPFGWAKLLWRLKFGAKRRARVLLMGVRPQYQKRFMGSAIATTLIERLYKSMNKAGYEDVELSWVLDDNKPMLRLIENGGARISKRYRVYEKPV